MIIIRRLAVLFPVLFFLSYIFAEGYEIKIKINGLANQQVILGHYLSKSMYPDDTIRLDNKGLGIFQNNIKLPQGLYIIFLPSSRYFDIVLGEDQNFSLDVDTSDFVRSLQIKGSIENQVFLDFQKFMMSIGKKSDSLSRLMKTTSDLALKDQYRNEIRVLYNSRTETIENIKKTYPNFFVSDFLKATVEVNVPDPPRNANNQIIDSTWQYYYYRNHYFDHFDFTDARLLRTPLYEEKVMQFITKVIPQIPDTLIKHIDQVMEKAHSDSSVFRFLLITFFNHFAKSNIMGMDAVQVHLAEKYYLNEAWWSDEKFLSDLKERINKTKPLLIGKVAPDMDLMMVPDSHFQNALNDSALQRYPHVGTMISLSQIQAKYIVLVFWEADCGHCKTAVPELFEIYKNSLQKFGVKVLAVSTLFGEDGKVKWVKFLNDHQLYGWLNAWNPYSYEFKLKYDVVTTPQIFILDEQKKIIAKKISPAQVKEILLNINNE
jgi:thiol-disulfide isomerase/thioredoxin